MLQAVYCFLCCAQSTAPSPGQTQQGASQTAQLLASYEGQDVSSIEIAGHPELSVSQFASSLAQQSGKPFSQKDVNATAAALKSNGQFKEVRIQVEPEANGLRVLFILEPAVYIGIFQFPGASRFTYSRLVQIANYPSDTPFNQADIEQARQNLILFLRQQGYFQAQVQQELSTDSEHAIANVIFHTDLARQAKFGDIVIEGAPPEQTEHLRHGLTTLLARARGAAVRVGRTYNRSSLNKATQYLQTQLQKKDFLGAQVALSGAEYHADTNRADIHFKVTPGVLTHVEIEGAHLWSWTRKLLLPVYQGVGVDD